MKSARMDRFMKLRLLFTIFLAMTASALSQDAPASIDYETFHLTRVAQALRVTEKITLDGHLEEPTWSQALPISDFIQQRPNTGVLATERTIVRFLYDDENLYVGAICYDSDIEHRVIGSVQKDFNFIDNDGLNVIIDSLHDRRSGFSFNTNVLGAKRDQQLSNDGTGNQDWDGVWYVQTSINDDGWTAEYMIPLKTLRFTNSPSQVWGLQVSRRVLRINEESHWAPVPQRYSNFRVSLAGTLTGLEGIHQGRNFKVKPFVSGGVIQNRAADGSLQTDQNYDGGFDTKYSLTPSLTLDTTYRTDFAQVEVDQQQVNLTRFSLFLPEKRDFFLENSGIFTVGPGAFFNNASNLIPFFSRRIGLSAAGTQIPIIGGARVSGKVDRYDVGLLAMKTERLGATPSNNFLVGRVKRNLLKNSFIGAIVTDRDSKIANDYNRVYGADAHFQFFNKLEFDSYLLASDTPGRTGKNHARRFETGWRDEELIVTTEYNAIQPNFNPELGFVRRGNNDQYSADFTWKPLLRKNQTIRNLNFGTNYDYWAGSSSGKVETRTNDTTFGVAFESNAQINFVINRMFDRLSTSLRIPSGNPRVTIPAGDYQFRGYNANFTTNPRRKITGNGSYIWGDFYDGDHRQVIGGLNLKFNYHLTTSFTIDRNHVRLPSGSFTTELIGAKAVYGFSPKALLNAFIQYNADTHVISSNIRFDLIHHPLSDLFIVYNDTRSTLTHQTRERVFIVKLTNLFTF
jgi:hypothetical protein